MIWYLNLHYAELKSQFISSLLALLKNFRWLFFASQIILTFQEQLCFLIKIVQGVCSCFSLFNLQGTPLHPQPIQSHVTASSTEVSAA